jgi:phage terminase Nu1 subunit (DNA packaging protein)
MKTYINEQAVSEITGFKLPTLRNHRHLRKGIPYIKAGRSVRYDLEDVESYMKRHRIDPEDMCASNSK